MLLLKEAFCGCNLATGTKIIAWIYLVIHGIILFIFGLAVYAGAAVFKEAEKNTAVFAGSKSSFDDSYGLFGGGSKTKPEDIAQMVTDAKYTSLAMVILVYVMLLIPFLSTILLLVGAAKEKPNYLLPWLVSAIFSIIYAAYTLTPYGAVIFLLELYFVWIVYSYFMTLRMSQHHPRRSEPQTLKVVAGIPCSAPPPPYRV